MIISLEVVVEPHPAEHTTAKVYLNGIEVTGEPIEVLSNATVDVVFTVVEEGYCFEDDHSTVQTNTVTATDNPTKVEGPVVVRIPSLTEYETQQAKYEVKEAVVETAVSVQVVTDPSVTLKLGGQTISEDNYAYACEFYGIEPKTKPETPQVPTAEDFRVVSKDAQVIGSDEIAVKKESIQAAKAETVSIANNEIQLGVSVMSNSNITAEIADWGKVNLLSENVKVENGNVVISTPTPERNGGRLMSVDGA